MKNTIKFFSIASGFLVAFILMTPSGYAAVDNGGLSGGCNTVTDCGASLDFYDGQCRDHIETIDDCGLGGWTKVSFSCSSGCSGSCGAGEIRCSGQCVTPQIDNGSPSCASQGLGFNQCTGTCGSCTSGYVMVNGTCLKPLDVLDDTVDAFSVGNPAYKIWDGTDLTEAVHVGNTGCANDEVAVSDSASPTGWVCSSQTIYLRDVIDGIIDFAETIMSELGDPAANVSAIVTALTNLANGGTPAQIAQYQSDLATALAAFQINLPSIGYFVGTTGSSYNGNRGGYDNANDLCASAYADSHICTASEMIASYSVSPIGPISGLSSDVWINNGPPGYVVYRANDCNGWQLNDSNKFGSTWSGSVGASFVCPCNQSIKFACCK